MKSARGASILIPIFGLQFLLVPFRPPPVSISFQQRSYSINANVRPSVCMYVCLLGLGGNVIFSDLNKIELSFFVCPFLLYMSIYSINFVSVVLSVRLQKAKELRYLWILSSLFFKAKLLFRFKCQSIIRQVMKIHLT